jgi:hypothetical protein
MRKFLKLGLLVGALSLSLSAVAEFRAGMSAADVESEVAVRLSNNETLESIAAAAALVGIRADFLTSSLIHQGKDAVAVVTALVAANMPAGLVVGAAISVIGNTSPNVGSVVTAAIDAGEVNSVASEALVTSVVTSALNAGVNPTTVTNAALSAGVPTDLVTRATAAGGAGTGGAGAGAGGAGTGTGLLTSGGTSLSPH